MSITIDFDKLKTAPRILIEVGLKPVAGTRIQPTGFPDLGPATYDVPGEKGEAVATLLVESAQSMANRLEAVCWDEGKDELVEEMSGLPYIKVKLAGLPGDGKDTTCSILEFHRLNSPYIMAGVTKDNVPFANVLKPELGMATVTGTGKKGKGKAKGNGASSEEPAGTEKEPDDVAGVVNLRKLAAICFKYDPNSIIHGVFLEKIAGRLRHPRALSAFIEASGVGRADSGGVKFDRVLPKPKVAGVDAKGGYGNVPFHRTEFTAKSITAFFSIDLVQVRGYGLGEGAWKLLVALSLWKVRRFLDSNMRLRTACELELINQDIVCRYKDAERKDQQFILPSAAELTKQTGELIAECKSQFASPTVTELTWNNPKNKE